MKLRRADWLFVLGVVLVVGMVSLLPSPRDRNPPVPGTPAHRGLAAEPRCLACHVPEGARPLSDRHPNRKDCFKCHRFQPGEAVPGREPVRAAGPGPRPESWPVLRIALMGKE